MRIMFKHILFLISLLAFLGAIQAYGGIEEDLDAQLKELAELNKPSSVARAPAKLDPPTPLPEKEKAPVLSEEEEEELVEETVEETGEEKVSKKSLTQAPRIKVQTSEEIPAPKTALANMEEIQNPHPLPPATPLPSTPPPVKSGNAFLIIIIVLLPTNVSSEIIAGP